MRWRMLNVAPRMPISAAATSVGPAYGHTGSLGAFLSPSARLSSFAQSQSAARLSFAVVVAGVVCVTGCVVVCAGGCVVVCAGGCVVVCAGGCVVVCAGGCVVVCAGGCVVVCAGGCVVVCAGGCVVVCATGCVDVCACGRPPKPARRRRTMS